MPSSAWNKASDFSLPNFLAIDAIAMMKKDAYKHYLLFLILKYILPNATMNLRSASIPLSLSFLTAQLQIFAKADCFATSTLDIPKVW